MILSKEKTQIIKVIFILYVALIIYITQFPLHLNFNLNFQNINYNLVPFHIIFKRYEVIQQMKDAGYRIDIIANMKIIIQSFGFNIILFLPFGFLLPILNHNYFSFLKIITVSFVFSLSIEILQLIIMIILISPSRVFDVDDIIANIIGGILGFYVYYFTRKFLFLVQKHKERHSV
ncbi:VanZ family protein [Ruminiclostridium josui]|uniref:VanZ family protein n=1 Tax=Ruminiclostridium josui TaxID=1499 RepID=UPI00046566D3|nr:VanZ family protein [Ruminiclostridium josui]